MNNLDALAARVSQQMVRDFAPEGVQEVKKKATELDSMATKALGVLQEQGVYAGMLYLFSKGNDPCARMLRKKLLGVFEYEELKAFDIGLPGDKDEPKWQDVGEHLTAKVCDDLDTLLLVKQVWEQTLIYARYGAKARGER